MKKTLPKIEPSEVPQLLRLSEVAAMLGLHPKTVYHWVRMGRVEAVASPGGMLRVKVEDARALCHKAGLPVPTYIASVPRKAIVADADTSASKAAKRQLRARGFDVVTTENLYQAFLKAAKDPPELMVVDVQDQSLDVFQMVAALLEDERTKSIRFVAWSDIDEAKAEAVLGRGFSGVAPRGDVGALLISSLGKKS